MKIRHAKSTFYIKCLILLTRQKSHIVRFIKCYTVQHTYFMLETLTFVTKYVIMNILLEKSYSAYGRVHQLTTMYKIHALD